jgi:hypothetical protein
VNLPANELAALLVAISFAAGLNIYATLATLGLLSHADLLPLPTTLHLLSNWWIIAASGTMFVIEFFADKIPAFDLIWNALHTFVRVPLAGVAGLCRNLPAFSRETTPRHSAGRSHCPGCTRRQDSSAGGCDPIS